MERYASICVRFATYKNLFNRPTEILGAEPKRALSYLCSKHLLCMKEYVFLSSLNSLAVRLKVGTVGEFKKAWSMFYLRAG